MKTSSLTVLLAFGLAALPFRLLTAEEFPAIRTSELPSAPELRSSNPGPRVKVVFENVSSAPVTLYWMNGKGERNPGKVLPPGGSTAGNSNGGYVYAVESMDGTLIKAFPIPDQDSKILLEAADWKGVATSTLKMEYADRSRSTGRSMELAIRNGTRNEIRVYLLDMSGNEKLYSDVQPGNTYTVSTSEWHIWVIRDSGGNALAKFEADPKHTDILVDGPSKK